jgi:hypothetical protein
MSFSRKTTVILLSLLILLNLVMRLKTVPHESGVDSFEMHLLANSLSTFGEARWWVHPLSIIGMYPNSYASGVSFLTSGISQVSGLDIDKSILIYSIIGSFLSIFASYLIAGVINQNDFFRFIVSFIYSLSPGIVEYTTWTAQGRSLFLLMFPIFLFLLLKPKRLSLRYIFLFFIFGLFIITLHHLFFYLIPIVFVFLTLKLIFYANKYFSLPSKINEMMPFIVLLMLFLMVAYPFLTGKFMTLNSKWANLANLPIEYPRYIGIPIILSVGGFVYLAFKKGKSFSEWFLLGSFILLSVFIFDTMYTKWIMILLFSMLAGVACLNIININSQNYEPYKKYVIPLFIIAVVMTSGYFQFIKEYDYKSIDENTFETGLWIKDYLNGVGIGNSRWDTWKIGSIAAQPILTGSSSTDQAYGLVDARNFELGKFPPTSEKYWKDSPYYRISGKVSDSYWQLIFAQYYTSKGYQYIDHFNISYLVDSTKLGNRWFSHHGSGSSDFMIDVHRENNCVYDSGMWNLWVL